MKIKTSELTGPALRWAVLVASIEPEKRDWVVYALNKPAASWPLINAFHPDTDWAHGGPIIGREQISLTQFKGHPCRAHLGTVVQFEHAMFAPEGQPLVAAMRCYVASRLGDEVDIPEELL